MSNYYQSKFLQKFEISEITRKMLHLPIGLHQFGLQIRSLWTWLTRVFKKVTSLKFNDWRKRVKANACWAWPCLIEFHDFPLNMTQSLSLLSY